MTILILLMIMLYNIMYKVKTDAFLMFSHVNEMAPETDGAVEVNTQKKVWKHLSKDHHSKREWTSSLL